jgi:hypothetical protein
MNEYLLWKDGKAVEVKETDEEKKTLLPKQRKKLAVPKVDENSVLKDVLTEFSITFKIYIYIKYNKIS